MNLDLRLINTMGPIPPPTYGGLVDWDPIDVASSISMTFLFLLWYFSLSSLLLVLCLPSFIDNLVNFSTMGLYWLMLGFFVGLLLNRLSLSWIYFLLEWLILIHGPRGLTPVTPLARICEGFAMLFTVPH